MYNLAKSFQVTDTPDGVVLLDKRRGKYYRLNATGSVCLRAMMRGHGEAEVCAELVRITDAPIEQVRPDVQAMVAELLRKGVVSK